MKIKRIIIKNFRLLNDFTIDLEDNLSLIVGKNNSGKTSLLVALDKFINYGSADGSKRIKYNDFNLDFQKEIEKLLSGDKIEEQQFTSKSISLRIIVHYDDKDKLDNVNKILTNLDDDNNYLALGFDYVLDYDGYLKMLTEYKEAKGKFDQTHGKSQEDKSDFDVRDFLNTNQDRYFHLLRKSIDVNKDTMQLNEDNYVDLQTVLGFHLDDVINFKYIGARRSVDNKEVDKTLSAQTSELYKAQEDSEENEEARDKFISHLKETDSELTDIYDGVFKDIIGKVSQLGGMRRNDTVIKVISTLQHRELLKGNTTVVYEHNQRELPENYNGLSYMNLISIIFEIELCVEKMKRANSRRPADINLLFIEEPEAHTHPQMQYVFIKNIKSLLKGGIERNDGVKAELQTVVTTHSSHIVADSDFDDIKYFRRIENTNSVESKNLKDLKALYGGDDEASYRFLKQYLTLMNSELFFADKAIFIEGDTERILLPIMMKKVDEKTKPDIENGELGLLSQNISLLPIGAHSQIFEKFFHFIGLTKILVITDIDIVSMDGHHTKEEYDGSKNQVTSNSALKHYFDKSEISYYKGLSKEQKLLRWDETDMKMKPDPTGNMMVSFETEENGFQPRSFEDCFFAKNKDFIDKAKFEDNALKPAELEKFKNDQNVYKLAENGVVSKAALAIDIIKEETDQNKWEVPSYIEEGLLWLRS